MAFMNVNDPAAKKYKDKVIGKTALERAPQEYWNIGAAMDMRISPSEWKTLEIHDRAKLLARHYLKNMIEVIDAHYKEQESEIEKLGKKK